jgi:hypothetical protein
MSFAGAAALVGVLGTAVIYGSDVFASVLWARAGLQGIALVALLVAAR